MSRLSAIEELSISQSNTQMTATLRESLSEDRLSQLSELDRSGGEDSSDSRDNSLDLTTEGVGVVKSNHLVALGVGGGNVVGGTTGGIVQIGGGGVVEGGGEVPRRSQFSPPTSIPIGTIKAHRSSREFFRLSGIGLGPSDNNEQIGVTNLSSAQTRDSPTDEEHPHEGAPSFPTSRTTPGVDLNDPNDSSAINRRSGFSFDMKNPLLTPGGFDRRPSFSRMFSQPAPSFKTQHSLESGVSGVNNVAAGLNRLSLAIPPNKFQNGPRPSFERYASLQPHFRGQRDPRLVGTRLPNPVLRNSAFHRASHPLPNQQLLALPRGERQKPKRTTSIGQRVLIGCLFTTYLVLALFTVLFVVGQAQFGVFKRGYQQTVAIPRTLLDPSSPGYIIYVLIHVWNLAWVVWAVALTFQASTDRISCFRPIPTTLSPLLFGEVTFGVMAQVLWIFTWDRHIQYASLWLLGLQFWAFLLALVVVSSNLLKHFDNFQQNFYIEMCFIKITCQNGVAALFTMSLIESLLTLDLLMSNGDIYYLSQDLSATLILTLVSITILIYFIMDACIFEKGIRFVITPYLCFTWTFSASLFTNWAFFSQRNVVILVSIILISALLAGARIIISILNERKSRRHTGKPKANRADPLNLIIPLPGTTTASEQI